MIVQALIAHPPAATDEFFRGRIDQMIDLGAVLRHAAEVEHKSPATGAVWPGTTALAVLSHPVV